MVKKHPYSRLRPNTTVWITIKKHRSADELGDIRKTRVKEISGDSILLCQPSKELKQAQVGKVLNISWLECASDGRIFRRMLEAELLGLKEYGPADDPVWVLLFGQPAQVYTGSLRREMRVKIPRSEQAFVRVTDISGNQIGHREHYSLVDLSTLGLRFACEKFFPGKEGPDPLSKYRVRDRIRFAVILDFKTVMEAEAVVRTKVHPVVTGGEVVHLGVEFSKVVKEEAGTGKKRIQRFQESDGEVFLPYIAKYQKMVLPHG